MKALKWIGIILAVFLIVLATWGMFIEPRFLLDQTQIEGDLPNLPREWEGGKIAFLADLQVGMWLDNTGMVEKVVEEVIAGQPDVVLIGGDFVYKPNESKIDKAVNLVRPLGESGIPVFAVLGNHDYSLEKQDGQKNERLAEQLATKLEEAGIEVLENEAVVIERSDGVLHLVGIGSDWANNSAPERALSGIGSDAPRVIFMHNPLAYRDLEAGTAPLTLAAHTHGGQIRVPGLESESWLDIARDREVIADGWSRDDVGAAGNHLYVNRGIGFSLVPIRFLCRPELTWVTLRRGEPTIPGQPS